jgi:hypothetical protein
MEYFIRKYKIDIVQNLPIQFMNFIKQDLVLEIATTVVTVFC